MILCFCDGIVSWHILLCCSTDCVGFCYDVCRLHGHTWHLFNDLSPGQPG